MTTDNGGGIQRFHIPTGPGEEANPHNTGEWVLYSDAAKIIEELREEIGLLRGALGILGKAELDKIQLRRIAAQEGK